jgi:hypothetical protein
MPSLPLLKALGLNFSPNQLEVTPGSLVEASNVIIRRDNVIESRRGYALYGTAMGTGTDRCKQLATYKNKLIRHFANRLQYENGLNNSGVTSFFDFNEIVNGVSQQAVITEAQAGLRIKSIEANSNLYLTTSDGIKKISSKSASTFPAANITNAGGVKALDAQAFLNTTIGDQSSFLPSDSGVAYKIVWGTKDASNNLILGTPSDPITILNPLLDLTLKDFSNFLLQMDNMVNVGNSIFPTPSDYYSTLALPIDATSVELRDRLILLANKLDEDLLFATATGTGAAYQPLELLPSVSTTAATTIGLNTITVVSATGITVGMRVEGGHVVYGFVTNVSGTTITLSSPAISTTAATPVTFHGTTVSSGVVTVHFSSASTPSNYFISGDRINVPVDPANAILGFTSNNVGVDGINTNRTVTSVGLDKITFNAANYTVANPNGISGNITASTTGGPGSITITAPNHGLKDSQKITVSGSVNINGTYVITYLTPDSFLITAVSAVPASQTGIWDIVIDGILSAEIESYTFRSIEVPADQSIPATNSQLKSVQRYYSEILLALQDFIAARGSNIVDSADYAAYLQNLDATSNSSVTLKITIPPTVLQYSAASNPYFYQIYRTNIAIVDGVSTISDIAIIQEYTQIEEKFPAAGELSSGIVTYLDNTPESIAGTGANLYTNERTGEGGLQANDVPPFALDINQFRGHTFFSNTRTRQRKSITLIGVVNMINNYDPSDPYKLTISDGTVTNTYEFVTGLPEATELTCGAAIDVANSGASDYFTLNSANNETEYYVWFQSGTSVDPVATVPALLNKTGIRVVLEGTDVATDVAAKTKNAIANVLDSFFADLFNSVVTTTADASTSTFTSASHGFLNGDVIQLVSSGELPAGLNNNNYYVVNSALNTFQLSLAPGGQVVTFTTDGTATIRAYRLATSGSSVLIKTIEPGLVTNAAFPSTPPTNFSISITQDGRGEDVSTRKVLLSPNASVGIAIEETAKSLIRVINQNPFEFINGFYISGTETTPGTILLESRNLSSDEFYIMGSDSIIGESFNPDLSPGAITITSITTTPSGTTVTTSANHNLLNGDKVVISNTDATPLIPPLNGTSITDGVHQITWLSATTFTIPVLITGPATKGVFESVGVAEVSSNEEQPHRVYYSKFQQPEAVPILNYLDVGATDKNILRIFPLRDSLFVFKEDGLFRISGEVAPFSVALFDSSCILLAPDSIAVANNQVYGWTTQGISTVTEAGVNVISRPIDTEILTKASSQFTNFKTATWGVGYESDNSYTVYTTDKISDDKGTIGFRYSNLTNSWTTVAKSATCGLVNFIDDKLYLGAGDTNFIEKERKEFTRYDYADRELGFSIVAGALSGNTISLATVVGLSVGDVVVQDQTLTVYEFNALLQKLDIDPGVPHSNYYSTLAAQAGDDLRAKIVALASKLDTDLLTSVYSSDIASLSGSILTASIANPTVIQTSAPHGLKNGRIITIAGNTQTEVNGNFTTTVIAPDEFTIPVDVLIQGTGGTFTTIDNSFEDIKVCYNLIIARLNSDTVVAFNNYRPVDNNTIQEAIINSIDVISKKITLNLALEYVFGAIKIFKAIPCSLTYSPITMGDPLGIKHIREATMMFANKAFTRAEVDFSTDLLPEFIPVTFNGDGNGIFGHSPFGSGFFGGGSNSAPFRTFIPRQCQRCRYINVGFSHRVAREQFAIYGITLTGEVGQSTRAYR